jgi:hypothetical protein
MTKLLKSTKSAGRGSVNDTGLLFFQSVSAFAVIGTFFTAEIIFCIIIDTISLNIEDHISSVWLILVWTYTHAFYTVFVFVGVYGSMSTGFFKLDVMVGSLSSILNLVMTFFFLKKLMSYNRQLYIRQKTTTPEAPPVVIHINNEEPPPPPNIFRTISTQDAGEQIMQTNDKN